MRSLLRTGLLVVALAACGCQDRAEDAAPPQPTATPVASPSPEVTPSATPEEFRPQSLAFGDGMTGEKQRAGSGPAAADGDLVLLDLTIMDDVENEQWRGEFLITLGIGQGIEGLNRGVEGMQAGERRRLRIPWQLAYGEFGDPKVRIAPRQDLIVDVELKSIEAAEQLEN